MKLQNTLIALLCAGVFTAPVLAAGPNLDKAVTLASKNSGASLNDICLATYKAVKEAPEQADEVFSQVISQRSTWTAGEVYAIFRSVLLARPDLEANFSDYVASYKGGKNAKDAPEAPSSMHPTIYKLLNALHEASLPEGVVQTVINSLNQDALGLPDISSRVAAGVEGGAEGGTNTNLTPAIDDFIIPTPPPVSPGN